MPGFVLDSLTAIGDSWIGLLAVTFAALQVSGARPQCQGFADSVGPSRPNWQFSFVKRGESRIEVVAYDNRWHPCQR